VFLKDDEMTAFYFEMDKHSLPSKRLIQAWILAVCMLVVMSLTPMAIAQAVISARPGMISFIMGNAYIDGKSVQIANQIYPFLNEGQWLQTKLGIAELLLTPEVFLRLDKGGELRLVRGSWGDVQVELRKGSAIVEVVKIAKDDKIQVQCAGSSIDLKSKGVYRFDTDPARLRVYGGTAEASSASGTVMAAGGKAVALANTFSVSKFSVKSSDSFHQWAARRSFHLFVSNSEALTTQTHWGLSSSGQSRNEDFHVILYSPEIAKEYDRRYSYIQQAKASDQANRERWRLEDEKELWERQERLRQEQLQQQREQQQQQPPQNKKP
jgi:hypothetical protein